MIKIVNITYATAYLNQLANNETQLNSEEITKLLTHLEYLEELFDGTLGDWATEIVD